MVELINGSIIQILGSEQDINNLVGMGADIIVLDECTLLPVDLWVYLLPVVVMSKTAQFILTGTPRPSAWVRDLMLSPPDPLEIINDMLDRGKTEMREMNMTSEQYKCLVYGERSGITEEEAKEQKDFYKNHVFFDCLELSVAKTGLIDPITLEATKQSLFATTGNNNKFRQEFLLDWEAANNSSIYGDHMELLRREGRLATYEHNPNYEVCASLDLGMGDLTVIVVWQRVGNRIYILDCYAANNSINDHYIQYLSNHTLPIKRVFLPHDSHDRDKETGRNVLNYYINRLPNMTIVYLQRTQSVETDITKVKSYFAGVYFNSGSTGVKRLVKELDNYDYKRNKNTGKISTPAKPEHNDYADAFRYSVIPAFEDLNTIRNRLT